MIAFTPSKITKMLGCSGFDGSKKTLALERGSIIHSIIDNSNNYNKEFSVYRGDKTPFQFEHNFKEYEELVDDIKEDYPQFFTQDWLKEVELSITYNDKFLGEIEFNGIIDKLQLKEKEATLVDWKTGATRANKDNPIEMLQSIFYSFLVMQKYQYLEKVTFNYVYVEQSHIITQTIVNSPESRKNLYRYLRMWAFAAIQNKGTYKVTSKCNWCQKLTTCPFIDEELKAIELEKDRLTVEKVKLYKSLISSIYDSRKKEIIDESPTDKIKIMNYFYVAKNDLETGDLLELMPDIIKVNKVKAKELEEKGVHVENRKTKALR